MSHRYCLDGHGRWHVSCVACAHVAHVDLNAAHNIRAAVLARLERVDQAAGEKMTGSDR